MIYAVWIPLVVPLLAVPAARRVAECPSPRAAAWILTALTLALALSSTAALGLLALAGALRVPFVAALGHLSPPLLGRGSPTTAPAAVVAAVALTALAAAVLRRTHRHVRELRTARRQFGGGASAGDLWVRQDDRPEAYALPGRPGRIVVSSGMLRSLSAPEREVLFAHERAHLAHGHHVFLAAAELASVLHPALHGLRTPIGYALERWADESAAETTGDRTLTARAIARAALAAHTGSACARPRLSLTATAGPVPRRVFALLAAHPAAPGTRRPRPWVMARLLSAAVLLTCVTLSTAAAVEAATDLHTGIEIAQGEAHGRPDAVR
ncbi:MULTISPECIES: M56 family metallopeptidase [Streptomyces]|uniref:M56 family metallopeptidase n=1 Tax=Streptomyces sp. 900129855 TaxID=3155129 RepID=A0ABV2ZLE0_9ACTN